MPTKPKIKIKDNDDLRLHIDALYENTDQVLLAVWAIKCAQHIFPLIKEADPNDKTILDCIKVNEQWQAGNASVHEVRQAGFKVHELARKCKSKISETGLRALGQAIAVGHMREHAMVCSDYAIKTIQLAYPGNDEIITEERKLQLAILLEVIG